MGRRSYHRRLEVGRGDGGALWLPVTPGEDEGVVGGAHPPRRQGPRPCRAGVRPRRLGRYLGERVPLPISERLRLLVKTTGEALWDGDLITGVWKWDGATEALFGYRSPRERTRAWWEERIHPEDRARVLAGLACALDGSAGTWENEYRFRSRSACGCW